jgi:hypothetical protein
MNKKSWKITLLIIIFLILLGIGYDVTPPNNDMLKYVSIYLVILWGIIAWRF